MQIAAVIFPSLVFPWRCFRGTISGNAFLPGSFHSSFTPRRINLSLPSREPHPWFCFLRWDHFHQNGLSWRGKDHFYFLFSLTFSFSSFHSTFSHFLFFFSSSGMSPFMLTPLEEWEKKKKMYWLDGVMRMAQCFVWQSL